jgi:hypothetical protein
MTDRRDSRPGDLAFSPSCCRFSAAKKFLVTCKESRTASTDAQEADFRLLYAANPSAHRNFLQETLK